MKNKLSLNHYRKLKKVLENYKLIRKKIAIYQFIASQLKRNKSLKMNDYNMDLY